MSIMECGFFTNRYGKSELLKWIDSGMSSKEYIEKWLKHGSVAPRKAEWVKEDEKPKDHKCPKADKCIMDCYHKELHEYEEKFCNDLDGQCNTKCVDEMLSDCTFFDEDFLI